MKLTNDNINSELKTYLQDLQTLKLPEVQSNVLKFMYDLKRKPMGFGRYPGVSLFEASNRIFSDLVILIGVRQILKEKHIGNIKLPFTEYQVQLGVDEGSDIKARFGSISLEGEAFNVSHTFFQSKKYSALKKLKEISVNYRLIIFNADAVKDPHYYIMKSEPSMMYLPIDIWPHMNELFS